MKSPSPKCHATSDTEVTFAPWSRQNLGACIQPSRLATRVGTARQLALGGWEALVIVRWLQGRGGSGALPPSLCPARGSGPLGDCPLEGSAAQASVEAKPAGQVGRELGAGMPDINQGRINPQKST